MNKCYKCNKDKPSDEFHKDGTRGNGLSNKCKNCMARMGHDWYVNVGRLKRDKDYLVVHREIQKNYNTYEHRKQILKKYGDRNAEKIKARHAVHRATKLGLLRKEPCNDCGEKKAEAHHHKGYKKDYQLIVEWLCAYHHAQRHLKYPK